MAVETTTQAGIRSSSKMYDDVNLFKGMLKLDDANINQYDPFIGGYGTFWWTKLPPFVELGNKTLAERFRNLTEKGHTGFDGIQDLTMNLDDITGGMAGNTFKAVTNAKEDFDTFTLKVYELQGSPIREAMEYWLTGIRDPKTGYANYHGQVDTIEGGYCARNHTGELLYIVTDPSGSSNGIEYACMICNIMPTKVPKGHLNTTHGDHPIVQLDLEFTGVKYESSYINAKAKTLLAKKRVIESYLDFNPVNLQV